MPDKEFTITRVFSASRETVWTMLTDAKHLCKWWGPPGMPMQARTMELHPGGMFLYSLTLPDGKPMWAKFTYERIDPPSQLTFINAFSDAEGGLSRYPGEPDWPREMHTTITLQEQGGKTTLTLKSHAINATDAERKVFLGGHASMDQGYGASFDQLGKYLAALPGA
ncbi:MAG TPA: SRPBCC domain-containing protein [Candidatus Peribacteria bacterium]|nr:SRPBCC domain-containing protein [Candidatus Peribacteria bacterium]